MRRVLPVLFTLLFVAIGVLVPSTAVPVMAQTTTSIEFDTASMFTYTIDGYTATDPLGVYGVSLRSSGTVDNGGYRHSDAVITVTLDPAWNITSVSLVARVAITGDNAGTSIYYSYNNFSDGYFPMGAPGTSAWGAANPLTPGTGHSHVSFSVQGNGSVDSVSWIDHIIFTIDNLATSTPTPTPTPTPTATPGGGGTGDLTRPLADSDIDPIFGIWDKASREDDPIVHINELHPDPNLVIAMSIAANDKVYSVAAGVVISIDRVISYCFGLTEYTSETDMRLCQFGFDPGVFDGSGIDYFTYYRVQVQQSVLYRVVVSGVDGTFEYITENALSYLRLGQEIRQGCIIGETTIITNALSPDNENAAPTLYGAFISLLDEDGTTRLPLLDLLGQPAVPTSACNANPDEALCIVDPSLTDTSTWGTTGGATFLAGGGVELYPNAQVYTTILNLVDGVDYQGRFKIDNSNWVPISISRAAFQVAGTTDNNVDLNADAVVYDVPAATYHTGDSQLIAVTNLSDHPIVVLRICISDGTASSRPAQCLFSNYSFDQGLTDWQHSGPAISTGMQGEIMIGNGSTLWQNFMLYPNGAVQHDYRLYVRAWIDASYLSDATSTTQFDWTFGTGSGSFTGPDSTAAFHVANYGNFPGREAEFTATVPITAVTSGNFYIALTVAGDTSIPIRVRDICIDDTFETFDRGGGLPPLTPVCTRITPPGDSEGVGQWTYFLWQSLDQFFRCDLLTLMNRMYTTMQYQLDMMRWSVLYAQTVVIQDVKWVQTSVFPWLGGHLSNIAYGRTTTIIEGSGGCNDIWCVLGYLTHGIDSGFGAFGQLISIVQQVISFLIGLLTSIWNLLSGIVQPLLSLLFTLLNDVLILITRIVTMLGALSSGWDAMNQPIRSIDTVSSASVSPYEIEGGGGTQPIHDSTTTMQAVDHAASFFDCSINPRQNPFCITVWLLDNTVMYSFGEMFVWCVIIATAPNAILWAVSRIKKGVQWLRAF